MRPGSEAGKQAFCRVTPERGRRFGRIRTIPAPTLSVKLTIA